MECIIVLNHVLYLCSLCCILAVLCSMLTFCTLSLLLVLYYCCLCCIVTVVLYPFLLFCILATCVVSLLFVLLSLLFVLYPCCLYSTLAVCALFIFSLSPSFCYPCHSCSVIISFAMQQNKLQTSFNISRTDRVIFLFLSENFFSVIAQ